MPTSYLRATRPDSRAWPRLLLGILLGAIGFLVVTTAVLLLVIGVDRLLGGHTVVTTTRITPVLLLGTNLGLGACIPLAWLLTWLLYRKKPRWIGSVAPGLRPRWFLTCLWVTGVVWGALFAVILLAAAADPKARVNGSVIAAIVIVLLTQPLQAAGEEYLFRGFLMQSLGATGLPGPVCWVVSGLLFATAHAQFAPPLFADRLLIGVAFGWLATRTGGLEASISIHALKNISVLIPAAFLGQLSGALSPTGVTWIPFVLDAVMLAIVSLWLRSRARRVRPPQHAAVT